MMVATNPTMASLEAERPKKGGPKTLAHMEIHPSLKGGHTVKHVYAGYKHEPSEYQFKAGEEERMSSHIAKHLGIKAVKAEGSKHENERDIEDEPSEHPSGSSKKGLPGSHFRNSRAVRTPSR